MSSFSHLNLGTDADCITVTRFRDHATTHVCNDQSNEPHGVKLTRVYIGKRHPEHIL